MIVGAGGHGLATAYYLAKNHKMTNIAILEKGWLGGGNTGRNTTIIRSNYLQDASIAIYELARSLYEGLCQELNYNVMFSPRGVLMLCQTEHELRAFKRTAHANRLAGLDCRMISPAEVKKSFPSSMMIRTAAIPFSAPITSRAAARRGMMRWPGAMPAVPMRWASTSSRIAKSPASRARAEKLWGLKHRAVRSRRRKSAS